MLNRPVTRISFIFAALIFGSASPVLAGDLEGYIEKASDIKSITIEATGQRFEPQQTAIPGAPSRHTSNYNLTSQWAPKQQRVNENWELTTVYPFPNKLTFQAQYDTAGGLLQGRDGFRPNTTGLVTSARMGAVTKDLWLTNPLVLLAHAKSVEGVVSSLGDSNTYTFDALDTQWTVTQDPETEFPIEIKTIENDHLEGSITNRVLFSDWLMVSGTPFPFRVEQTINDRLIKREVRDKITLNEAIDPINRDASHEATLNQEQRDRGWDMSHFFLRRAMLGGPSDGDEAAKVEIKTVEKGIFQIVGSSHHTIVIEGRDGLALVDAVWYPRRSEAVLKAIKEKWGRKPIKYVILTHHHVDHIGGLQSFANLDATIVMGEKTYPYVYDILINTQEMPPRMRPVNKRLTLEGIGRDIELFDVPNSHANDMIAIYVPDTKTAINSDLYSPGRPTQHPVWSVEYASAVKFHGLDVKNHVASHGNGRKPHSDLVSLTSKGN